MKIACVQIFLLKWRGCLSADFLAGSVQLSHFVVHGTNL
jgi:hypothetical protein